MPTLSSISSASISQAVYRTEHPLLAAIRALFRCQPGTDHRINPAVPITAAQIAQLAQTHPKLDFGDGCNVRVHLSSTGVVALVGADSTIILHDHPGSDPSPGIATQGADAAPTTITQIPGKLGEATLAYACVSPENAQATARAFSYMAENPAPQSGSLAWSIVQADHTREVMAAAYPEARGPGGEGYYCLTDEGGVPLRTGYRHFDESPAGKLSVALCADGHGVCFPATKILGAIANGTLPPVTLARFPTIGTAALFELGHGEMVKVRHSAPGVTTASWHDPRTNTSECLVYDANTGLLQSARCPTPPGVPIVSVTGALASLNDVEVLATAAPDAAPSGIRSAVCLRHHISQGGVWGPACETAFRTCFWEARTFLELLSPATTSPGGPAVPGGEAYPQVDVPQEDVQNAIAAARAAGDLFEDVLARLSSDPVDWKSASEMAAMIPAAFTRCHPTLEILRTVLVEAASAGLMRGAAQSQP